MVFSAGAGVALCTEYVAEIAVEVGFGHAPRRGWGVDFEVVAHIKRIDYMTFEV